MVAVAAFARSGLTFAKRHRKLGLALIVLNEIRGVLVVTGVVWPFVRHLFH